MITGILKDENVNNEKKQVNEIINEDWKWKSERILCTRMCKI